MQHPPHLSATLYWHTKVKAMPFWLHIAKNIQELLEKFIPTKVC
jgi:hypothetical protein